MRRVSMKIGLIGGGAIAHFLLETIAAQENSTLKITDILVRDREKYKSLTEKYDITLHTNIEQFLAEPVDIVVEAATVEAVEIYLPYVLSKKDAVVISIGAFVDQGFFQRMTGLAKAHERTIYLPSGAIGGLDLLQHAHALDGLHDVSLTTRKPAHTLTAEKIIEEKIIFQGTAEEAIQQFPKNINVAIVLSLATIGIKQTKVSIIADPQAENNEHRIDATGEFGTMSLTVTNEPLPTNPNTSYLAALSLFSTLSNLNTSIKIG